MVRILEPNIWFEPVGLDSIHHDAPAAKIVKLWAPSNLLQRPFYLIDLFSNTYIIWVSRIDRSTKEISTEGMEIFSYLPAISSEEELEA